MKYFTEPKQEPDEKEIEKRKVKVDVRNTLRMIGVLTNRVL